MEKQSIDLFCVFLKKTSKKRWRCVKICKIEKGEKRSGREEVSKRMRSISQVLEAWIFVKWWEDRCSCSPKCGWSRGKEETGQRLQPEHEKSLNTMLKCGDKELPKLGKWGSDKIKTEKQWLHPCGGCTGTEQAWWQGDTWWALGKSRAISREPRSQSRKCSVSGDRRTAIQESFNFSTLGTWWDGRIDICFG